MKSVIILAVVATTIGVFAQPQDRASPEQKTQALASKCAQENEMSEDMLTSEIIESDNPEHKIKCFHACMFTNMGLMKNDGTVLKEKLMNFPPEMPENTKKMLSSLMEPCTTIKEANKCEAGFLLFNCIKQFNKNAQQ